MHDFDTACGRIIEIRRYVSPLGLNGQGARRELWELWIKTPIGTEEKVTFESRSMQARRGHRVVLALEAGTPVGMVNLTTRARMNCARSDPRLLHRPLDMAVPVGLTFASLFVATLLAPGLFLVTAPIAVLYVPFLMTARWFSRRSLQRRVEDMLDQIDRDVVSRGGRRRP